MNIKYINNIFLEFYDFNEVDDQLDVSKVYRAYKIWDHCKKILESDTSALARVDVISNLKRCINQRLKNIESNYFINDLPIFKNEKKYFEKLSSLKVIRPFMLQQLFEIRNDIEHNDSKPPSIKRTYELLDISWYFLKSTDQLVKVFKNDLLFDFSNKKSSIEYWIVLKFEPSKKWEIRLHGWVPKSFVKNKCQKNTIEVELNRLGTKVETKLADNHKDKLDSDLFIEGVLKPDVETMNYIVSAYLNI